MNPRRASGGFDARALRDALGARCPLTGDRLAFARETGLPFEQVSAAARAALDDAEAVLAIAAALALDPATMRPAPEGMIPFRGRVLWKSFGCALTVTRLVRGDDQRRAAKLSGAALASVSRAEAGRRLGAGTYIRLCAYAGRHPHFWTASEEALARLDALGRDLAEAKDPAAAEARIAAAKAEIATIVSREAR